MDYTTSLASNHLEKLCTYTFVYGFENRVPREELVHLSFLCHKPLSVSLSLWVWVCMCGHVRMQMSNDGDYRGSEIKGNIWLSWDDRRSLHLPASQNTHTHAATYKTSRHPKVCVYERRTHNSTFYHQTHATALQVCLLHYQKVGQVEADKMNRDGNETTRSDEECEEGV